MTLKATIHQGLLTGLKTDILTKWDTVEETPQVLATLDFSTPRASWTTGRTNFGSAYATHEWQLQSYSGGYAPDVGTETLTNDTGRTDAVMYGVCDGTDMVSVNCWEATGTGDSLCSDGTSAGDYDGTVDLAGRINIRGFGGASSDYLFCKYDNTRGWRVYCLSSGIRVQLTDGTNTASIDFTGAGLAAYFDGALHTIRFWIDQSAAVMYAATDLEAEQSVSIASVVGTTSNSAPFCINTSNGSGGATGVPGCQYLTPSLCVGANAQNHFEEDYWQHATHADIDIVDRDCLIGVPVGAGAIAHYSTNQIPLDYRTSWTTGNYGITSNTALTNLLTYSNASTGATNSNVTATDSAGQGASGMYEAQRLTASADNGYQARGFTSVAATEYTGSVYIIQNTASATGRVILYDETNATEMAATAFTAGATPQRITVTGTTGAGGVSASLRVEVDTNGQSVNTSDWQVIAGDFAGPLIRTEGATASLVASIYTSNGVPLNSLAGEVVSTFIQDSSALGDIFAAEETGGTLMFLGLINSSQRYVHRWRNVGASLEDSITSTATFTLGAESEAKSLWRTTGIDSNTYETVAYIDGTRENGGSLPLEQTFTDFDCTDFHVGSNGTDSQLDGSIQSIVVYDLPNTIS